MERIVVTGLGLVTSLGNDPETFWRALSEGQSGVVPSARPFAPWWAPALNFKSPNGYDRVVAMALEASESALRDAGTSFPVDQETGLFVSTSKGGTNSVSVHPGAEAFVQIWPDGAVQELRRRLGAGAFCVNVVAACATGIFALASAMRAMRAGDCRRAIVGVAESALNDLVLSGFGQMRVLTQRGPRPLRAERDGFAPGEGAAVFTLESLSDAERRGAKLWGEILGVGLTTDPLDPIKFDNSGRAIAAAVRRALASSGATADSIDAICPHATGTANNDLAECRGLFGALHGRAAEVPAFGLKASVGHLLGASAAVEFAACLLALQHNAVPPTLGEGKMDPECGLNVDGALRPMPLKKIMSLNFGFGGHVGAIVVGKP